MNGTRRRQAALWSAVLEHSPISPKIARVDSYRLVHEGSKSPSDWAHCVILRGDTGPTSNWVLILGLAIGITCILFGSTVLGLIAIVAVLLLNLPRLRRWISRSGPRR